MKIDVRLEIFVTYEQICLFNSSLDRPYNDWKKQHADQGFTWRSGSVSFSTIEEAGTHQIIINDCCTPVGAPNIIRSIMVPFDVYVSGAVEIGSISETFPLELSPGRYQLIFELIDNADSELPKAHLGIVAADGAVFKIVRADPGLNPGCELLLDASPA